MSERLPRICFVGLGIGGLEHAASAALGAVRDANVIAHLAPLTPKEWESVAPGVRRVALDDVYRTHGSGWPVYRAMKDVLVQEARRASEDDGYLAVAMYGHPLWFVSLTGQFREESGQLGVSVDVVPGLSSLDTMLLDSPVTLGESVAVVDTFRFVSERLTIDARLPMALYHFGEFCQQPDRRDDLHELLAQQRGEGTTVTLMVSGNTDLARSAQLSASIGDLKDLTERAVAGSSLVVPGVQTT